MERLLVTWLGLTDLRAVRRRDSEDLGAVLRLLRAEHFHYLWFLNDVGPGNPMGEDLPTTAEYQAWLFARLPAEHRPRAVYSTQFPPFRNQFRVALAKTDEILRAIHVRHGHDKELHLHVSPGQAAQQLALLLANRNLGACMWATWKPMNGELGVERVDFPAHVTVDVLRDVENSARQLPEGWDEEPLHPCFDSIAGGSRSLRYAKLRAQRVASSDAAVLILGESGTGKEMFARAIHQASRRRDGPFVTVNCVGFQDSLLEAEMFGVVPGAFTGAVPRSGLFRVADGGTLFLDEVGDMPFSLQARLLRTLQDGEIKPVGADQSLKTDVRVVAATHRDLKAMVREERFREDLYYRLAAFCLRVPALRERGGDVTLLSRTFLAEETINRQEEAKELSDGAVQALESHGWPGNVRELRQVMLRLAWGPHRRIEAADVILEIGADGVEAPEPALPLLNPSQFLSSLARHLAEIIDRYDQGRFSGIPRIETKRGRRAAPPAGPRLAYYLEQLLNYCALRKAKGVRSRAGDLVGLSKSLEAKKGDLDGHDVFRRSITEQE